MSTTHAKIALSETTATKLTPNGTHSGLDITIQNLDGSAYVFLGGLGVTTSDFGFRIQPGMAISFELPGRDALYAVTDTEGSEIGVIKTNLETGS